MNKKRVFVGLSGGVDSSVAAALLSARGGSAFGGKERGFDVCGIHIKMWSDPDIPCNFKEDRYDAMAVAARLDIPFQTWDFTKEYRRAVVEYMIREYAAGRTPNPDVMCNRHIKFGLFLKKALEAGANYIATGHYVRLHNIVPPSVILSDSERSRVDSSATPQNDGKTRHELLQAVDGNKDQSYFLWTLTQEQLAHCLFPIGEYTKPEVRELARKFGLSTAEKPDSQGICFIGEIDVREFLKRYIPERQGRVLTPAGKTVGAHEGATFYTIGQRQGLGIGGGIPYYVADKNLDTNTLVVAEGPYDAKLFKKELNATNINWISGKEPMLPLKCETRIRYRQLLQSCVIERISANDKQIHVRFKEPQRAVTPGQSIVFYQGGEMLGGGIIA